MVSCQMSSCVSRPVLLSTALLLCNHGRSHMPEGGKLNKHDLFPVQPKRASTSRSVLTSLQVSLLQKAVERKVLCVALTIHLQCTSNSVNYCQGTEVFLLHSYHT